MALHPKLQDAVQRLQIADVCLKSINASLVDSFVPGMDDEQDDFAIQSVLPTCRGIRSFSAESPPQRRRHVFEMFSGIRLLRNRPEGFVGLTAEELAEHVCATVECTFFVQYDEFQGDSDYLDDEAVALYGRDNVPFSMWPYWREVVQSACSRMGLPKIVLPTHRLRRPLPKPSESEELIKPAIEKSATGSR